MNAYELGKEARKILGGWSRDEFYVYIRPTTSLYAEPDKPAGQWWVVVVQIRSMPPHEFREEGRSFNDVILALGERVPRRKDLDSHRKISEQSVDEVYIGYAAPHALWKKKFDRVLESGAASDLLKRAYKKSKADREANKPTEALVGGGPGRALDAKAKGFGTEDTTKVKGHKPVKTKKKKSGKKSK